MAISGIQTINVGLQNESTGSDSLYTAFTKINNNFTTLSSCSSPFNTFTAGNGIGISANANSGIVTVTNTGVTNLVAGTNIVLSASNGEVTISSSASGNGTGGTVTSVGLVPVSNTRLTVTGSPIVSSGTFNIDLATTGVTSGTYTYPTITVDNYGRISNISNASSVGTVTSVAVTAGAGIQVTGSPITTSGNINIINTGVTRISAGTGVAVSGSNGNVTISVANLGGTVTSVGISSNALTISGSPITGAGTITVDLPANITATRFISTIATGTAPFTVSSNTVVANLNADLLDGYTTSSSATANTIALRDSNGNITANNITGTLVTATQNNITSIGSLGNLSVTGNANIGGSINLTTGNIIYTPRYGSFYSNVTQTNPVANAAMAMTFNNTVSANGVSVVSNSQLTVNKTGVYNIQFSAQVTKTDAGSDYMEIWLSKNGSAVPWTNTKLLLEGANTIQIASWNFVETLNATEYVQLMWASSDTDVQLVKIDAANTVANIDVPSVIVSITPVGA
jgi:hypothetical protein